jgi:predicted aspartyl protease
MKYKFERDSEGEIILLTVLIDGKHTFKMVLDTGASRTTIDSTALHMVDCQVGDSRETATIETANGIVTVDVFEVDSISSLGHTKRHVPIQVYDFLAHGILSDYDGLLGLDFFAGTKLCIDMITNTIEIFPPDEN